MRNRAGTRCLVALALLAAGCGGEAAPSTPPATVLAASSLREAVEEIAAEWRRRGGGETVLRFEATSTLARQIAEGAPADVLLAADPAWLDRVKTLERRDWVSNRLVCVVPAGDGAAAAPFDLARCGSLALAPGEVPAGKYAREALKGIGVEPPARVLYGANARDVLLKVAEMGAEAGIVYATDAAVEPRVRVAMTFPGSSHTRIVCAAGVLTEAGRPFAAALREPWALAIAERRGFRPVP
jgi:molybdate transport system substrate-binding protein